MNTIVANPYRLIVRNWHDDQIVLDQTFATMSDLDEAKASYMMDYNDPVRLKAGTHPAFDIAIRIVKPARRVPRRKKVAVNIWGFGA